MSWAAALGAAAACAGWAIAMTLAVSLRRRLSLVADAEHELRGAAAAIGLAAERISRSGATVAFPSMVRLQLDRMAAGLEDLSAARAPRAGARGRTASRGDEEMEAGRLAQVLGNLIANATEHGVGTVDVRTSRPAGAVRIEIRNRNRPRELDDASAARPAGRGRGLAIAERAARELGGRLSVESRGGETRAELELPARAKDAAADARGADGAEVAADRAGAADAGAPLAGGADVAADRAEADAGAASARGAEVPAAGSSGDARASRAA